MQVKNISRPHSPVPKPRVRREPDQLRISVTALDAGMAITVEVEGDEKAVHSNLSSRARAIGMEYTPHRRYSVSKMGGGSYQISRLS